MGAASFSRQIYLPGYFGAAKGGMEYNGMEIKSKKDYADEIRFVENELKLLQKSENELITEIEKKEAVLTKMSNSCCVKALVSLLFTMPPLWYAIIQVQLQEDFAWLANVNLLMMCVTAIGLWIYTGWNVRRLREQKTQSTYSRKMFLFPHPTLSAEIEELQDKRRDVYTRIEMFRIRKNQLQQCMDACRGKSWFLYEESINSKFTDEEKEELLNVIEENNTYHLLSVTESELFEVRADIRHVQQKKKGIAERGKRLRLLLSIEMIIITADIIPIILIPRSYDKTMVLEVVGGVFLAVLRMPFLFVLGFLLLLFTATCFKYFTYANNPVCGFIRHALGRESAEDIMKQLEEEEEQLAEEEKKLCYKKALLES